MRQKQGVFSLFLLSPSSRRAWIEIFALRSSSRNSGVALLAEGVDRNPIALSSRPVAREVALLAEGVDRNSVALPLFVRVRVSPSSRRAWIEILTRRRSLA